MAVLTTKKDIRTNSREQREQYDEVFLNKSRIPQTTIDHVKRVTSPENTKLAKAKRKKWLK